MNHIRLLIGISRGQALPQELPTLLVDTLDTKQFFFKDLSLHVTDYLDVLSDGPLEKFKHKFLIRNPAKAPSSLYKVHKTVHDERKYSGNIHLFQHLYRMYTFVQQKLDPCPLQLLLMLMTCCVIQRGS